MATAASPEPQALSAAGQEVRPRMKQHFHSSAGEGERGEEGPGHGSKPCCMQGAARGFPAHSTKPGTMGEWCGNPPAHSNKPVLWNILHGKGPRPGGLCGRHLMCKSAPLLSLQ
jgi:hypothetical protein